MKTIQEIEERKLKCGNCIMCVKFGEFSTKCTKKDLQITEHFTACENIIER